MAKTQAKKGNVFVNYLEASYQELRKVAWPTRNQAFRVTFLVLGSVIVMSMVIGVLDYVFGFGHRALLDLGPSVSAPVTSQDILPASNTVNVKDITAETADGETVSVEAVPVVDGGADTTSN